VTGRNSLSATLPGCPPRPEQLIYALVVLQQKIQDQSGTVKQVLNLA
jgi:NADH-quinone oxidoreductase subunit B